MELVNIEKLIDYKILPFDLFDKEGNVIFAAGEVLTSGKILQLRALEQIYRVPIKKVAETFGDDKSIQGKEFYDEEKQIETVEKESETDKAVRLLSISIDDIDTHEYIESVNIDSLIDTKTQIKLKAFYSILQDNLKNAPVNKITENYFEVRDKIVDDITAQIEEANMFSELKLLGDYVKCHDLNVAILANAFGMKYGLNNEELQEIVLAALLHDIGKKYLPKELLEKQNLTVKERRQLENHTIIGYEFIKQNLKLPEKIARPALQHHESTDGTGFPKKISEESIDLYSGIIGLCSYFDNLTSNKTEVKIKNVHEALRHIMVNCTKSYSSDILYTFVYMFSYNDVKNFEDMVM